jgi:hypothetical protein
MTAAAEVLPGAGGSGEAAAAATTAAAPPLPAISPEELAATVGVATAAAALLDRCCAGASAGVPCISPPSSSSAAAAEAATSAVQALSAALGALGCLPPATLAPAAPSLLAAAPSIVRAIHAISFSGSLHESLGGGGFGGAVTNPLRGALKGGLVGAVVIVSGLAAAGPASSPTVAPAIAANLGPLIASLTRLGNAAADAVEGGGGSGGGNLPPEMRSFGLINAAWSGIARILVGLPTMEEADTSADDPVGASVRAAAVVAATRAIADLVPRVSSSALAWAADPSPASKTTARFWAQTLAKVATAHPGGCVEAGGVYGPAGRALAAARARAERVPGADASSAAAPPPVVRDLARADAAVWGGLGAVPPARAATALAALLGGPNSGGALSLTTSLLEAAPRLASRPPTLAALLTAAIPALAQAAAAEGGALACDGALRTRAVGALAGALGSAAATRPAWDAAEAALFEAVLAVPHPAAREVVGSGWAAALECASPGMAFVHASALAAAARGAAVLGVVMGGGGSGGGGGDAAAPSPLSLLSDHLALTAARLAGVACAARPEVTERVLGRLAGPSLAAAAPAPTSRGVRDARVSAAASVTARLARLVAAASSPTTSEPLYWKAVGGPLSIAALASLARAEDGRDAAAALEALASAFGDENCGAPPPAARAAAQAAGAALPLAPACRPPPHAPPALRVLAAGLGHGHGTDRDAAPLGRLLPALGAWAAADPAIAAAAAALAPVAGSLRAPGTDALFGALLTPPHWAARHGAVSALIAHARSPASGDFRSAVPKGVWDPEVDGQGAALPTLMASLMKREAVGGGVGGVEAAVADAAALCEGVVGPAAAALLAAAVEQTAAGPPAPTTTTSRLQACLETAADALGEAVGLASGGGSAWAGLAAPLLGRAGRAVAALQAAAAAGGGGA